MIILKAQEIPEDLVGFFEPIESSVRSDVLKINPRGYDGAHYAVFPEALAEIPIRAGSAAQACPHCGAAWRRVVERDGGTWQDRKEAGHPSRYGLVPPQSVKVGTSQMRDLGFAPGCTCAGNDGSAASVVLDCFAGSGTTLRVAMRLQRNAIGIELSQNYIEDHIEKRTNGVQKEMFV